MSEEKKQMTVGDLKEKLKNIKLPPKNMVHLIAMIMGIFPWGLGMGAISPALSFLGSGIQGVGLIIMILNSFFREGNIF